MAEDYEVGFGKPPKHSRFQPGRSGNPRGRPKGARGLKTDLLAELSQRHTITINQTEVTASKQSLMVKTLVTRAAAGDLRAHKILLPLMTQIIGVEDRSDDLTRLSGQDQALLDAFLAGELGGYQPTDDMPAMDAGDGGQHD